ncbi:DUF2231 domain-containing protein [Yinghuangia sp. YIM S09857]|uniref:DUF2231 domain-containing protein n=1 Tax=Yinghuangia sp. YIM S09857 TaxID=3436929 RepID=UPI003F530484
MTPQSPAIARRSPHRRLVALPIAGYIGALAGYAAYGAHHDRFWLDFAITMNVFGVAAALVVALFGARDLTRAVPRSGPARSTAVTHAVLNTAALALFATALGLYVSAWNDPARGAAPGVTLCALGLAATITAAILGRSLVREHHIGVAQWKATETTRSPRL